jgi:hypothetical protein
MMKNLKVLLIVILSTILLSCKKDKPVITKGLVGEWELIAGINGLSGIRNNYERGRGNIIKFTQGTYETMRDGQITKKGTYTINSFQSLITNKEEMQIVYEGEANEVRTYFTIDGDTLIISIDTYDAPASIFTRIK